MIEELVSALPEVYQPIYRHQELSGQVSRSCEDRLKHIFRVHDALRNLLGRPIRVIDLGCAQGFFSLNLAKRGAVVHGVDFLDKNVAVCRALAEENPDLNTNFETGRIENVIDTLEPNKYDLVLGLSVFHHIVHEHGVSSVKEMLNRLASQCGVLILELALREEPLYWGPSQPETPMVLLDDLAFVHKIASHSTHLADLPRPFFIASNRYWVIDTVADEFYRWSENPHALAGGCHAGSRRYFFGQNYILKKYSFNNDNAVINKAEFKNEVNFFKNPPPDFHTPRAIFSEGNEQLEQEALIAIEKLPGRLLLELLQEGQDLDSYAIIISVLDKLVILENAGFYHNDVRTWNILVSDSGEINLIDFGSISKIAEDCVWPKNIFLSFFIFIRELLTGVVDNPVPLRTISISPFRLPSPYDNVALKLWNRPLNEWSFKLLRKALIDINPNDAYESLVDPHDAWMKAIEEAIQVQKKEHNYVNNVNIHFQKIVLETQEKARELQEQLISKQDQIRELLEQLISKQDQTRELQEQLISEQEQTRELQEQLIGEQEQTRELQEQLISEQEQTRELQVRLISEQEQAREAQEQVRESQAFAEEFHQRLLAVYASTSWRLTRPIRGIKRVLGGDMSFFKQAFAVLVLKIKILMRPWLINAIHYINRKPSVALHLKSNLARFPWLKQRLMRIVINQQPCSKISVAVPTEISNLTPRAQQIYKELQRAIELKNKGGK
ncbi:methyltransferase domain-containing protein [Aeromonas sp. R2-2]|uniref:class I SAM-dependent methyltransferase n=1 Tax=Aeromonas sp. R2-2 TaxID=3138460 RepID=UPI0034A2D834